MVGYSGFWAPIILIALAEKMCREYSTQEVTVNDETDEEAEYEIIDSNPIKSKNKWTIEHEEEEDRGFFILHTFFKAAVSNR